MARDDWFLIEFFGNYVKNYYPENTKEIFGELESVVIFMKAAVSKNRKANKLELLLGDNDEI